MEPIYQNSELRANIVSWLPIRKTDTVLEIGTDSEIITKKLQQMSENVSSLYTWEEIQQADGLKFDYVLLIGSLERAKDYVESGEPQKELLRRAYALCRKGGTLVIAMDNCYGLKFWGGSREEITGEYYSSIERDSIMEGCGPLSDCQIEKMLQQIGCQGWNKYYPYPDYRLTKTIYSDEYLPKKGELSDNMHNFSGLRLQMFQEDRVFDNLIEQNKFPQFSNSYLYMVE